MNPKLIIFDQDGVLVKSNDAHVEACQSALRKVGITDVPDEEIIKHFGENALVTLKNSMGSGYTEKKLKVAAEHYYSLTFSDWFLERIEKIPNLREFLIKLKKKKIKLAVASGNPNSFIEKILKYLDVNDVFDLIIGINDVKKSKPDPEMLLKAIEHFGVKPKETLFVADAPNDIIAGKKAGVKIAVVLTGVLDRKRAEKLGINFIFEDVTKLKF